MTALARSTDPMTSVFAAEKIDTAKLEGIVLQQLMACGDQGATTEELAAALNMDRVTVSPRMRPLCNKGLVVESDMRRVGRSGKKSIVWIAQKRSNV